MTRLAELVLRHRLLVSLTWLVLLLAGGAGAGALSGRLSLDFSLPGQPGYETEQKIIDTFGASASSPTILTVSAPSGQTLAGKQADVASAFDAVTKLQGVRLVDAATTGSDLFTTSDGRTAYALVYLAPPTDFSGGATYLALPETIAQSARAVGLTGVVTGYQALAAGSDTNAGPSLLLDTLIAAGGALVVLAFVFASFLALVPLLIAAVSILTTFLLVLGLTTFSDVSFVVQFLISLVGLGVAIDYSLLLVTRWREERDHGMENHAAVVRAMETAGHAVLASGVTVAISLVALVVVPVPLLRSMGFGGMLIPLVSVAATLTLLPALLSSIGPRVDSVRLRRETDASKGWTRWSAAIVRRPAVAAGTAMVILVLLIIPVFQIQIGQTGVSALATNGKAYDAFVGLTAGGVPQGALTPVEVLVTGGDPQAVAKAAAGVPGVAAAVTNGASEGGSAVVDVVPSLASLDSSSVKVVDQVREAVGGMPGVVGIAGDGATIEDYVNAVYKRFPLVLGIIAIITLVLLMRAFRSVLLPIKAVLLNLVSVGAVFGAVTWFWQLGHGSQALFNISATGAITFWLPVLIFAFLFGLSMDYEVFILSRMREEYDATGSTPQAIVTGLGRTGRLVTSAALILFFAFASFLAIPTTDLKVFGTALGVGILIDATVVRALLVPALVRLFGAYNWWMPTGLARILRIEPSPLQREPRPTAAPALTD